MAYHYQGQPTQPQYTTQQTSAINVPQQQRQSRGRPSTTAPYDYQEQSGTKSPISPSNRTNALVLQPIPSMVLSSQVHSLCLYNRRDSPQSPTLSHLILRQELIIKNNKVVNMSPISSDSRTNALIPNLQDIPRLIPDPLILRWHTPTQRMNRAF
jgi:hypothetical protein